MTREKVGAYTIILICVAVGLFFTCRYNSQMERIKENPAVTTGYLYSYVDDGSKYVGGTAHYRFNFNNTIFKSEDGYINIRKGNESQFIGKSFPVVYERDNAENSKILITPEDFETFHMQFPDSLAWVRKYLND